MNIIDLSLVIDESTQYAGFPRSKVYGKPESHTKIKEVASLEKDKVQSHNFTMCTQHFTHYDAPSHFIKGGLQNHEVPIDSFISETVVIDMMSKNSNDVVTANDLENSQVEVRPGDIVLIRTGWTNRHWGTFRFWEDMITLSTDAADWLIDKQIKSLALDFMACDHPLYPPTGRKWGTEDWSPNHKKFLSKNIVLLEWLYNLHEIAEERILFGCTPIKLKGTDGAPCRAFAIEGVI